MLNSQRVHTVPACQFAREHTPHSGLLVMQFDVKTIKREAARQPTKPTQPAPIKRKLSQVAQQQQQHQHQTTISMEKKPNTRAAHQPVRKAQQVEVLQKQMHAARYQPVNLPGVHCSCLFVAMHVNVGSVCQEVHDSDAATFTILDFSVASHQ